jgi:hypothetical protein
MLERVSQIAFILLAVFVLLFSGYYFGQRVHSDAAAVKQVLADMTVHANQLERQQLETRNFLLQFGADLRQLKNDDVDKLMRKYGL